MSLTTPTSLVTGGCGGAGGGLRKMEIANPSAAEEEQRLWCPWIIPPSSFLASFQGPHHNFGGLCSFYMVNVVKKINIVKIDYILNIEKNLHIGVGRLVKNW